MEQSERDPDDHDPNDRDTGQPDRDREASDEGPEEDRIADDGANVNVPDSSPVSPAERIRRRSVIPRRRRGRGACRRSLRRLC